MFTQTFPLSELSRWGRESRTIEAQIPVAQLGRLSDMLADTQGELTVKLSFSLLEANRLAIRGEVHGMLHLNCHRCMQPMDWPVALQFAQAAVSVGDHEAKVPPGYEPWLPSPEGVALWEIAEDELLLTLPDYPSHPHDQCKSAHVTTDSQPGGQNNPFAKLRNRL